MKIAVIHDYFTQLGGAEKVAEELYRMLPDPSLFATVAFPDCMPGQLKDVLVRTSWMPKTPRHRTLLPAHYSSLSARFVSDLDLSEYDLVLSQFLRLRQRRPNRP